MSQDSPGDPRSPIAAGVKIKNTGGHKGEYDPFAVAQQLADANDFKHAVKTISP